MINRFDGSGIPIQTNGGNVIKGNYIGTDVTGTLDLGNSAFGISVADGASANTIVGATAGGRNIISGNGDNGVLITGLGTDNNAVVGNFIGTDASGTASLGNSSGGITIEFGAQSNTIGGVTPGERNIISGNSGDGVVLRGFGTDNNTDSLVKTRFEEVPAL